MERKCKKREGTQQRDESNSKRKQKDEIKQSKYAGRALLGL